MIIFLGLVVSLYVILIHQLESPQNVIYLHNTWHQSPVVCGKMTRLLRPLSQLEWGRIAFHSQSKDIIRVLGAHISVYRTRQAHEAHIDDL